MRTTWNSGSEARVTGLINNLPSRMDHTHHRFTWNVAAQTADRDLGGVFLGITVTIETWETYLAIGNVLNMRLIRRTGVGSCIRYRDTVVRIRSISIECVGLEHLNGDQFDLPTSSMRRMSEHSWSPKSVALYKMEVTVSRASDLRLVRDRVSSLLGDMAPSDSIKNNHIEFLDSSSSETTVSIKVVLPINNANRLIVQALLEMELEARGVLVVKDLPDSESKYGPLRLVQVTVHIKRAA